MSDWLHQINFQLHSASAVVMVTVLRVQGSVPRKPGARMIISPHHQWGTIGGGNLEYAAVQLAHGRLQSQATTPHCEVMALGPSLGQCCGGRVELLFETIDLNNVPGIPREPSVLKRAIGAISSTCFESQILPADGRATGAEIFQLVQSDGQQYLLESIGLSQRSVWIFGAGHVGAAVVAQLSLLPCKVVWLDERAEFLQAQALAAPVSAGLKIVTTDDIVAEVYNAPAQTSFVIMTHSHATDYALCREILARNFSFVGLIGSKTKRRNFERRLRDRGITGDTIDKLVCPIGIQVIQSNHPHAIALSLAAQLVQHWETQS